MIGNMRTKNKNHGRNVGSKLAFVLCSVILCFNHVATIETSRLFLQREKEKKNLRDEKHRTLQTEDESGAYFVSWNLNLNGNENVLDSDYLRASFEQIAKDYINNDIKCEDETDETTTTFTSFEIDDSKTKTKKLATAGSGKCLGKRKKCFRLIKQTKPGPVNGSNSNITNKDRRNFCANFRESTIFESFQDIIIAASFFNYFVDVDIIQDTVGNLNLDYIVSFEPSVGDGLDQLDNITLDPFDPEDTNSICVDEECIQQKETMLEIFNHFDIPIVENQHECAYEGINCNQEDKVTYIWMGKY